MHAITPQQAWREAVAIASVALFKYQGSLDIGEARRIAGISCDVWRDFMKDRRDMTARLRQIRGDAS